MKTNFAALLGGNSGEVDVEEDEDRPGGWLGVIWDFQVTEENVGRLELRIIPYDGTGPVLQTVGVGYPDDDLAEIGEVPSGIILREEGATVANVPQRIQLLENGEDTGFVAIDASGTVSSAWRTDEGNYELSSTSSLVASYSFDDSYVLDSGRSFNHGSGRVAVMGAGVGSGRSARFQVNVVPLIDGQPGSPYELSTSLPVGPKGEAAIFRADRVLAGTALAPRFEGGELGAAILVAGTLGDDDQPIWISVHGDGAMELIPVDLPGGDAGLLSGEGSAVFSRSFSTYAEAPGSLDEVELWYHRPVGAGAEVGAVAIAADGSVTTIARFAVDELYEEFDVVPVETSAGIEQLVGLQSRVGLPSCFSLEPARTGTFTTRSCSISPRR
ncbi:MAG: hypothetical protein ACJAYU_002022 [Bradymonadia bacterium]